MKGQTEKMLSLLKVCLKVFCKTLGLRLKKSISEKKTSIFFKNLVFVKKFLKLVN